MNVSLTPALEKYIQKQVASGRYQTASEVIRQALRLMQQSDAYERAKLEALRQDIQVALDASDRGEFIEIRSEKDQQALLNRISREGRDRLAAKQRRRKA